MVSEITPICFGGMLGYGVNCYLVKGTDGYLLVDTAISPRRAGLEEQLQSAGCQPGNLKLIVLTHGHGDHTGNCVYLRDKYGPPIAMHRGDVEIVEQTLPHPSVFERILLKFLSWIAGIGENQSFTPDIFLEDGQTLAEYGWDAQVIHIPGHSNGSIGILTAAGDLFCGDVFVNVKKPARHTIVTDAAAFDASIAKLKALPVQCVYPGHGKPFRMEEIVR
jgi:glyoxylase-like metal-dependent hydrolase (beta-lactamase superfamily II)